MHACQFCLLSRAHVRLSVFMSVRACVYMCLCIYVRVCERAHACVLRVFVYVPARARVCVDVCMYVCVFVCVCVCILIPVYEPEFPTQKPKKN